MAFLAKLFPLRRFSVFFEIWSLCLYFTPNSCYQNATEEDVINLRKDLLDGYKAYLRPIANQSAPIDVHLDFLMLSINDVDDVRQQITIMALTDVSWHDKNLRWNPDNYGGLDTMSFDEKDIWTPQICLFKSYEVGGNIFEFPTNHIINSSGKVHYVSMVKLTTPCKLDLSSFPFDKQHCVLTFGVFGSRMREVVLTVGTSSNQTYFSTLWFIENGEWDLLGINPVPASEMNIIGYATGTILIKVHRRSQYYSLNILCPTFAISALCVLTFAIPMECSERLSYALTTHLSLSVYISYIGDIIPNASLDIPRVFYLVTALFLFSALGVAMSVFVMTIRWSEVTLHLNGAKTIHFLGFNIPIGRQKPQRRTKKVTADDSKFERKGGNEREYNCDPHCSERNPAMLREMKMLFSAIDANGLQHDRKINDGKQDKGVQSQAINLNCSSEFTGDSLPIDTDLRKVCVMVDRCCFVLAVLFIIISAVLAFDCV